MGIEFRWADGDYTRHEGGWWPVSSGRKWDVIVATSAPTAVAAKKVPRGAIPLVFTTGEDPVKEKRLSSAASTALAAIPRAFTLFTVGLGPKRLEILRELVPSAAIIAFLVNPKVASTEFQLKDVQDAARAIGQQIEIFAANSESELNVAFDNMGALKGRCAVGRSGPVLSGLALPVDRPSTSAFEFRQCTNGQISSRPAV